jgi:hypothetical protein
MSIFAQSEKNIIFFEKCVDKKVPLCYNNVVADEATKKEMGV